MRKLLILTVLSGLIIGGCGYSQETEKSTPKQEKISPAKQSGVPADAGKLKTKPAIPDKIEELIQPASRQRRASPKAGGGSEETSLGRLIRQLGDEDWSTRETAQKELTEIGEKLIEQYRKLKAVASSEDRVAREKPSPLTTHYSLLKEFADALREACQDKSPEIKMRANLIRQHLYNLTAPKIAFTSDRWNGNHEIYVMDANGKNQKRLTENKTSDKSPTWSPDGTKIAFVRGFGEKTEIYVMPVRLPAGETDPSGGDADGTNQQRLTKNKADDWSPAWSPDGKRIAFASRRDGNGEIYVMDTDGKNQKRLTENQVDDKSPAWSPDGKKIAFVSDRDDNAEIYVMDTDGKNQKRLTQHKARDRGWYGRPTWSPDGTKIAFVLRQVGSGTNIYVMDANGKNQKRLTENQFGNTNPSWSPDGTKIAFESNRGSNWDIYVMDTDGSNPKNLTKHPSWDAQPAWSPDGTKIAFWSNRDGNGDIYMMNADGSSPKNLTKHPAIEYSPAWSPAPLIEIFALFADRKEK